MSQPQFNEYVASNQMGVLDSDREHADWIEIINTGSEPVDLAGYGLSDDPDERRKWVFPARVLQPGEMILVFASGKDRSGSQLHVNFAIDSEGEELSLCDADGNVLDSICTGRMYAEHSRGRDPRAGAWVYYLVPTPGERNGEDGLPGYAVIPEPSVRPGLYNAAVEVGLSPGQPHTSDEVVIRYTRDGSEPTPSSPLCSHVIPIDTTTVLRAAAFQENLHRSPIWTGTYVIEEPSTLPVVSLATSPAHLWDPETGIHAMGPEAETEFPYWGANFWHNWERPVHIECFGAGGGERFRLDAGIRIHGNISRAFTQKSFRIYARGGYGKKSIDCRVFGDKEIDSFKRIILRNSGGDFLKGQLRDGLLHRLASQLGLPRQGYKPARVYVNGEYWGLMNIRERVDGHFLESNFGADPDELDLLRNLDEINEGNREDYDDLLDYIERHDVREDSHFAQVEQRVDVANFADYYIFRIFAASRDWPRNNSVYWRPWRLGAKWRWILLDAEWGLGLGWATPERKTLKLLLDPEHPDNRNPPWATFLFRELLRNQRFKENFINRFADYLNAAFLPEQTVALTRELAMALEPEIPRHMDRWAGDRLVWQEEIESIEDFFIRRPSFMRAHLAEEFDLGSTLIFSLDVLPSGGGCVELTAISVGDRWSGGFTFVGWSDLDLPQEPAVEIRPERDCSLVAFFQDEATGLSGHSVHPNPFSSSVSLWFELAKDSAVSLAIHDVSGRRVREYVPMKLEAGYRAVMWDGCDDSGDSVPAGVYFYELVSGTTRNVGRMVVVR